MSIKKPAIGFFSYVLSLTWSVCPAQENTPTPVHLYHGASGKKTRGNLRVAVIKVNMTGLLWLPLLPCFNPSFSLSCLVSSFSSSSSVFCPIFSLLPPPALLRQPSDGCWWHLCSVSQMSHNRNWNINLTVNMSEKWWGGGKGLPVLLFSKVLWALLCISSV